jgi:hypothetical protein
MDAISIIQAASPEIASTFASHVCSVPLDDYLPKT